MRLFHNVGAATLNAQLLWTVRFRGTCSNSRNADRNVTMNSLMRFDSSECRYTWREAERILYVRSNQLLNQLLVNQSVTGD